MKVTECLNTEHGVFLLQLAVLERMLAERAPDGEIRAVALAIAEAVEQHRSAEEELLYPAILREFGEGFPPIQVMEAEHAEIGRCIQALAARGGSIPDAARDFIGVLREHIAKEIHVLFPLAEQRIPGPDLERMACRCTERHSRAAGATPCGHGHA